VNADPKVLTRAIARALAGRSAHLDPARVFEGLDWKLVGARPEGAAHSLFQLINHMVFWQDWTLNWLDGKKSLSTAGSWRGSNGPGNPEEWELAVRRFRSGLDELTRHARKTDLLSRRGRTSRLEMLHTVASHNSYHAGQVVVLRQTLGAWPPLSSGRRKGAAS
jgi:uncharacterized damage-inducible protein DinB